MRIACNRCETRYDLPEERLDRGPVKIRCKRCGHVFAVRRRPEAAEASETSARLLDAERSPSPPGPPPGPVLRAREPVPEDGSAARFEDFDFSSFELPAPAPAEPPPEPTPGAPAAPERTPSLFDEDELPSLGELDLSDFGETDRPGGFHFEEQAPAPENVPPGEPERVRSEDLLRSPPAAREAPLQGVADAIPRLDLQKGPRRSEPAGYPTRTAPRDRRRSPLVWVVGVAALAVGSWTGYNLWKQTAASTFLDPARIKELWLTRKVEASFPTDDLKGYPQTLPGGRRVFVIRGKVVNNSKSPQGLIRVKGSLFGPDGKKIAASEVYCGNVLSERELATLPKASIEARLLNQVGEGLSNVDIAPGAKVPFLVVFFSPPPRVEKYTVHVTAARKGAGS